MSAATISVMGASSQALRRNASRPPGQCGFCRRAASYPQTRSMMMNSSSACLPARMAAAGLADRRERPQWRRAMQGAATQAGGLEAVFLANRDVLLRFLRARGAGDAAEDLLQELWVRIEQANVGPIAEPLSYLYRTANNLMLDRRRSALRSARRDTEWGDLSAIGGSYEEPSGERVLIAREQLRAAEEALQALGERTAVIFRRYRLDGVSQRDIAAEQGISLSAVEKHLQKAYRAMIDIQQAFHAD
jgi:RNA polymerase sigma factor (sigma-70 family)